MLLYIFEYISEKCLIFQDLAASHLVYLTGSFVGFRKEDKVRDVEMMATGGSLFPK